LTLDFDPLFGVDEPRTFAGNGTFLGTVSGSGRVSPGDGVGRLTIDRIAFGTGTFIFELNGPVAGTSYDQLVILSYLNYGGELRLLSNFHPTFGSTFLILDNQSSALSFDS